EHLVTVISYKTWQQRFAEDPAAIGRSIHINGRPFTILGVAPADFFGVEPESEVALWVPLMTYQQILGADPSQLQSTSRWLSLIGRLAPTITLERARQVASAVAQDVSASMGTE